MLIVPWKNGSELGELRRLFQSEKTDDKQHGVDIVRAYLLRGKVLASVEATALLTAAQLLDLTSKSVSDLEVRMSYSLAIIKFVNGLLDPYQRSVHAIPLHQIAKKIGLPSSFVETRHIATHENLPSLQLLRQQCRDALEWLDTQFWAVNEIAEVAEAPDPRDAIKQQMRLYRRAIRDNSADLSCLDSVITTFKTSPMAVCHVLFFRNVLIVRKAKFSHLRLAYSQFFHVMEKACVKFYETVFEYLANQIAEEKFGDDTETAMSWVRHFVNPKYGKSSLSGGFLRRVGESVGGELQTVIKKELSSRGEKWREGERTKENEEGDKKRKKLGRASWEKIEGYVPTPFGIPI